MKTNIRSYRKGASERRVDIQIDKWDTYNLDYTISLIILPMLLQLKHTKMGVPNEFVSSIGSDIDSNYCFDFIDEDQDAVFDQGCKKWEDTLDHMIWAFQQLVSDDYSEKYQHGKMKVGWKKVERMNPATGNLEKMYEMVDENPEEHWYDMDGHMLHEERIQEGIDLFAKYFRSLWD